MPISGPSNEETVTTSTDDVTAPGSPEINSTSLTQIEVAIVDRSGNEDEFRLYQDTDPDVATTDTLAATVTTLDEAGTGGTVILVATGLTAATTYFFRATAYNADTGVESPLSREIYAATDQGPALREYDGSAWIARPLYHYDGSSFVRSGALKKRSDGVWKP